MLNAIESALFITLLSDPDITTLFSGRVYTLQAPSNVALPFIVLRHQAGGMLTDNPRAGIDVRYEVFCAAETRDAAADGAALIQAALHGQPLTITGWVHMDTTGDAWFSEVINKGGEQFYRAGAQYRIRASGL
jgi:hypothetical protein